MSRTYGRPTERVEQVTPDPLEGKTREQLEARLLELAPQLAAEGTVLPLRPRQGPETTEAGSTETGQNQTG